MWAWSLVLYSLAVLCLFYTIRQTRENRKLRHLVHEAVKKAALLERNLEVEIDLKVAAWKAVEEPKVRQDAIQRSKQVNRGQAYEQLAPYMLPGINPKDCRFLGSPIDMIVFDGLAEILNGELDELREVQIIDVKTGSADLNKGQRRIRNCIREGRVSFKVFNAETGEIS